MMGVGKVIFSLGRIVSGEMRRSPSASLALALKIYSVYYVFSNYVIDICTCVSPPLADIDHNHFAIVLVDRTAPFATGRIERDDIIVATSPMDPNVTICNRITAIPGDPLPTTGQFRQGPNDFHKLGLLKMPRGRVWLQSDSIHYEHNSIADSRSFGPMPAGLMKGRVLMRLWPPSS
jgi:mitochondrial inner membrane protease subunit 1